jgi:hypothetical protein
MNKELLAQTLEYIREHPEEHHPNDWQRCFAGTALKLAGLKFNDVGSSYVTDEDGDKVLASKAAREKLGLEYDQDRELFNHTNTFEDLEHIVAELTGY